jgi:hypothetical protein
MKSILLEYLHRKYADKLKAEAAWDKWRLATRSSIPLGRSLAERLPSK